jgi:SAM-dependent methyltransferase
MAAPASLPATLGSDASPAQRLIELVEGYWVAQITAVLARLGVADVLADGPRSSREVARVLGAMPHSLARFLRAAVAAGLLEEIEPDRFALTPIGAFLGPSGGPSGPSLRDFAIAFTDVAHWRSWERLADVVMTGRCHTSQALGMELWEHYQRHADARARLQGAAEEMSVLVSPQIAAHYDVSRFRRIVDVGGGHGVVLAEFLARRPEARGALIDTPEVIPGARDFLAARGLADRVELVPGNMLEAVPPGGDLYVIKSVIPNWDDERAARILRNCQRVAAPDSRLLIIGFLLPTPPETSLYQLLDLEMLVLAGGRGRTREDYRALLAGAGWELERVISVLDGVDLVEGRRLVAPAP